MDRDDKLGVYLRYLELCNQHLFDQLGEYVAPDVGGSTKGLANYIKGCSDVVGAFPDYRWILQHTVVEDDWLAARLIGVGTHSGPFRGVPPTGKVIRTQEMVMYRFAENKIAECWGDLHTTVRDELVSGS